METTCTLIVIAVSEELVDKIGNIVTDIKHTLGTAYIEGVEAVNVIKLLRRVQEEEKDIVKDRLAAYSGGILPVYIESTIDNFENMADLHPNYLNIVI